MCWKRLVVICSWGPRCCAIREVRQWLELWSQRSDAVPVRILARTMIERWGRGQIIEQSQATARMKRATSNSIQAKLMQSLIGARC